MWPIRHVLESVLLKLLQFINVLINAGGLVLISSTVQLLLKFPLNAHISLLQVYHLLLL